MSEHELWNELGNLYFSSGSYDKAVRAYNRAVALKPEVGEPCSNLALTYVQMGKYDEAAEFYRRSIRLLKDELDRAVSLHKLGDIYLHLKQYPQAAETYQQTEDLVSDFGQIVESSEPFDLLLHCQHEGVSDQQVQFDILDANFSSRLSEGDEAPFVEELTPWWFEGQIAPEDEPNPENEIWFINESDMTESSESVVFTDPLTWESEADSQTPVKREAKVNEEHQSLQAQNEVDVDTVETEINPAAVMVVADGSEVITNSPEFSAQNITDVEAVQYDVAVNHQGVDLTNEELLEIEADIERFKQALETNPRNSYAWDVLGGHYKTLGRYEDAIHAYESAVRIDSTQAFYFHHLALVYAAVGRHDNAIHAFERVIEVDPDHGLAHATLGGYYRKNGNVDRAKVHIEKAMELLDGDENEYNRACMEAICGNADRSLELLEIALKNKQTYVNWARKDPDLDFIRSDPRFQALLTEFAVKHV